MGAAWWRTVPVATAALLVAVGGIGRALPPSFDADDDGHVDAIETRLSSDPADAASTPESVALAGSCFDGLDNDGDAAVDDADSGCTVLAPATDKFPAAGLDVFDSTMTLDDYALAVGGGTCLVDFAATGPVVVQRTSPSGEPMPVIDVEMIAMQLTGTGTILSGGSNCPVTPGDYEVTVVESAGQASAGQVRDTTADAATDFPADSFFDVFFDLIVDVNGTDVVLPGGPPNGPAGDPVHVQNQINGIPPYHGGKNPLCYEVAGLAHEHCPKAPPDHYTCYASKFSPRFQKREVLLRDQFDADAGTQHRALRPLLFCNPAAKNGEPLYEPTGHLKCYTLKPEKQRRVAQVRNQFGLRTVETKISQVLCLASEKNDEGEPTELDDFECYRGKFTPRFAKRDITLVDQFGTVDTEVKKPQLLCNPASRDGQPIRNPLAHLECFALKPRRVRQTVTVRNDWGEETVVTKKAVMVCVPSGKSEGTATTTTLPPGSTTTSTSSTTTLPSTGIDLVTSYTHPTPGVPPSFVCGRVSGPPAAMVDILVTGPGVIGNGMVMLQLDGSGTAPFQVPIDSFGTYQVRATFGSQVEMAPVNVGPTPATCP